MDLPNNANIVFQPAHNLQVTTPIFSFDIKFSFLCLHALCM